MKYTGNFKNVNEETIQVNINTGDDIIIPYNYTRTSYIYSDGTAYINTGVCPTNNTRVYVKYMATTGWSGARHALGLFGSRQAYCNKAFDCFVIANANNLDQVEYCRTAFGGHTCQFNTIETVDLNKNNLYYDDELIKTFNVNEFTSSLPMYLFAINTGGSKDSQTYIGNIYECQIYENDVLVRNFIPCISSDEVAGFYDTVTETFYTSTEGTLTAGGIIETELTFIQESPIIITQTSSDGLFSPIKSRSCTITIVTNENYFDMYSASSHGTSVEVNNITNGECLFYGYITPCEYNQPYRFLNEIELEAIDAVSTLMDFKYNYTASLSNHIKKIKDLLVTALTEMLDYENIYVNVNGDKLPDSAAPFINEYISDLMFADGEDSFTWYEIITEICKYYKCSLIPVGKDIFIVDYNVLNLSSEVTNGIEFYNLVDDTTSYITDAYSTITKDDYAGSDPNIEIDEVFNKVTLKADVDEIDDDELFVETKDHLSKGTFFQTVESTRQKSDGTTYTSHIRLFQFSHNTTGLFDDINSNWQTLFYYNTDGSQTESSTTLTDSFSNVHTSMATVYRHLYWSTSQGSLNAIPGICALPSQCFNYASDSVPYKAEWDDRILFFPQICWFNDYLRYNNVQYTSHNTQGVSVSEFWYGQLYEEHLGGNNPVLRYISPKIIQFSSLEYGMRGLERIPKYKNWLCISCGIIIQKDRIESGNTTYAIWTADIQNHIYNAPLNPESDNGASDVTLFERSKSNEDYNKGWGLLKMKINIGNKYWNGDSWTVEETTFIMNFHKQNVSSENEELVWLGKNKPVNNFTFEDQVNKDCYAIPITLEDDLCGQLRIEIYPPILPYENNNIVVNSDGTYYIQYTRTSPVVFMEDFKVEFISVDQTKTWLHDLEEDEDTDIEYTNEISSNNVIEYDDLSLKINTYRHEKYKGESYILENPYDDIYAAIRYFSTTTNIASDGTATTTNNTQEKNIVNEYVQHHSTPKIIYNCQVHNYFKPYSCFKTTAIDTDTYMMVDEQEYDVKANINSIKLIQI